MKHIVFFSIHNIGVKMWRYSSYIYESEMRLQHEVMFSQLSNFVADKQFIDSVDVMCFNCVYNSNTLNYMRWLKQVNPKLKIKLLVDDFCFYEKIPNYIKNKTVFISNKESTIEIMKFVDEIITTTPTLKNNYVSYAGISADKITVVPNLLPVAWLPNVVSPNEKVEHFKMIKSGKRKPRIGVCLLANHLNLTGNREDDNGNLYAKTDDDVYMDMTTELQVPIVPHGTKLVADDSSLVVDVIRDTVDIYEWNIIGCVPPSLVDVVKNGKVKYVQGCGIHAYIKFLHSLDLDLAIVPLLNNEFNRCKSNIKVLEYYSICVPCFVSDVGVYDALVREDFRFKGQFSKDRLRDYFAKSTGYVQNCITQNCKVITSKFRSDNHSWNSYILDDNFIQIDGIFSKVQPEQQVVSSESLSTQLSVQS